MKKNKLLQELEYKATKSSGPGGQNVNKVASKVTVSLHVENSEALSEEEKSRIHKKLEKKITSEGVIQLSSDTERSQLKNKSIVTKRLFELLEKALVVPKKRKETQVPTSVKEKRIKEKKSTSEIKQNRRKPEI